MKKVKIMLMSFAVIAAVGGALAFKANSRLLYCSTESDGQCTIWTTTAVTYQNVGTPIQDLFCTELGKTTDCTLDVTNE